MNSNVYLDTGREHYFQHYSKSKLPIRDVIVKTEPHIEIGAENYLRRCYQPSKNMSTHSAVLGDTYIVPFNKGLEYSKLGIKRSRAMQRFDHIQTGTILELIYKLPNILNDCIVEMIRMENRERKNGHIIALDHECLGSKGICAHSEYCLRKRASV